MSIFFFLSLAAIRKCHSLDRLYTTKSCFLYFRDQEVEDYGTGKLGACQRWCASWLIAGFFSVLFTCWNGLDSSLGSYIKSLTPFMRLSLSDTSSFWVLPTSPCPPLGVQVSTQESWGRMKSIYITMKQIIALKIGSENRKFLLKYLIFSKD